MTAALLMASVCSLDYETLKVAGWTVRVRREVLQDQSAEWGKALPLMGRQLKEIVEVVPKDAVEKLRTGTLWVSRESTGAGAGAAYHPGAAWLKEHGRDPAMAKGVEFTNVRIFEAETRRMPNFCLHELAHAFHDRFLPGGFENRDILSAFRASVATGKYEDVWRRDAEGKESRSKHYGLTNQMEFFAETTEAYFARNDFQPWNRSDLLSFDPGAAEAVRKAWGAP